jgi:ATP-dependent RNA helicase DeaD
MFRSAGIQPTWMPITGPEEIRALDQKRLAEAVAALCTDPTDEDLEVARKLLEERAPEQLVAALVRAQRSRMPAPEDLPMTAALRDRAKAPRHFVRSDAGPLHPARPGSYFQRDPSKPQAPQAAHASSTRGQEPIAGVWFRLNVGRLRNADPRWLVPLICRRGGLVKADIGKIVIMPKETRFLIRTSVADAFERAALQPDKTDPAVRFQRLPGQAERAKK